MKPTIFSKSFKMLIITLLLLATLFNRKLSQQLMLAAILIWVAMTVFCLFGFRIITLLSLIRAKLTRWKEQMNQVAEIRRQTAVRAEAEQSESAPVKEMPTTAPSSAPTCIGTEQQEQEQKRMLQHISLRITEKIKSAYPDATWQWETEPCLFAILEGRTFRIAAHDMDHYTHADVRFDQFGRIHITPLVIGEFATTGNTGATSDEEAKEPPVVDVQSWYELIGKQILEKIIADLNASGHNRLTIKENGDIVITRNKKESLKGNLKQFPPKNYWNELMKLLEEYELQGKAEKDHIIISWT